MLNNQKFTFRSSLLSFTICNCYTGKLNSDSNIFVIMIEIETNSLFCISTEKIFYNFIKPKLIHLKIIQLKNIFTSHTKVGHDFCRDKVHKEEATCLTRLDRLNLGYRMQK